MSNKPDKLFIPDGMVDTEWALSSGLVEQSPSDQDPGSAVYASSARTLGDTYSHLGMRKTTRRYCLELLLPELEHK